MSKLLNENIKEIDYEFFEKLITFYNQQDESFINYFKENYNLSYIGEVAERFLERSLIKNSKELTTLNIMLGEYSFPESKFQKNQKKQYIKNVIKWIEKNNISKKEKTSLYSTLVFYIFSKIEEFNEETMDILENIFDFLKKEEEKDIWFEICFLFNAYDKVEYKNKYKEELQDILKIMLNNLDINLKNLNFKFISSIIPILFKNKEKSIIKLLDLKVKDFKDNKHILNILKCFRKISFNELKEKDIEKIQETLNFTKLEISILNSICSYHNISYNGSIRIKEQMYKYYFLNTDSSNKYINEYILKNNETRAFISNFETYYPEENIEIMTTIIENFLNKNYINKFSKNTFKRFLLNDEIRSLLNKEQYEICLTISLNTFGIKKEEFEILLKLYNESNYSIEKQKFYYFNLFNLNYIDILDIEYIEYNDIVNYAIEYVDNNYKYIKLMVYISLFNIEKLEKVKDKLNYKRFLKELEEENLSFKDIALKFKLTTELNLEETKYKKIVVSKIIDKIIELNFRYNIDSSFEILYDILNNEKLIEFTNFSKQEVFSIKKLMFENKLLKDKYLEELKYIFLNENELLNLKVSEGINKLKTDNFTHSYYTENKFIHFFNDYKNILEKSIELSEKFIEKLNETLDDNYFKKDLGNFLKLNFLIYNSNCGNKFKNEIFSIINKKFIEFYCK